MKCCTQEKETCSQLLSGEGNWCFNVSGGGIWCDTVLSRKKLVNCCSQEKETCCQLFLGEENMYTTVIRRRKLVLYCSTVLEKRAMGLYLSVLSI